MSHSRQPRQATCAAAQGPPDSPRPSRQGPGKVVSAGQRPIFRERKREYTKVSRVPVNRRPSPMADPCRASSSVDDGGSLESLLRRASDQRICDFAGTLPSLGGVPLSSLSAATDENPGPRTWAGWLSTFGRDCGQPALMAFTLAV